MPSAHPAPAPLFPARSHPVMSRIAIITLLAVLMLGCETTIEVDAPAYSPELVLEGTATTNALRVDVSQTSSAFSRGSYLETIRDANITATTDRGTWSLPYVDSLGLYVAPDDFEASPETPFQVRADADGFAPASARDTIPPAPVASIELGGISETSEYSFPTRTIRITLTDPSGPNYYALHVIGKETVRDENGDVIFTDRRAIGYESTAPPIVTSAPPQGLSDTGTFSGIGVYFDDALFDGTTTSLSIDVPLWFPDDTGGRRTIEYFVEVSAVSSAMFTYERDVEAHSETSENPFAEPTVVEGNVDGGQGVVGGFFMRRFPVPNRSR